VNNRIADLASPQAFVCLRYYFLRISHPSSPFERVSVVCLAAARPLARI
jgi:hypothetical protein